MPLLRTPPRVMLRSPLYAPLVGKWAPAAPSGPFNPTTLFGGSDNGGWYDASDLTTLFQDTAGTTPVASDGDPVRLIKDKSGKGHNLRLISGTAPVWHTGSGLSWIAFASGQFLAELTGSQVISGTLYAGVANKPTDNNTGNSLGILTAGTSDQFVLSRSSGGVGANYNSAGDIYTQRLAISNNINMYAEAATASVGSISTDVMVNKVAGSVVLNQTPAVSGATGAIGINASSNSAGSASTQNFYAGIVINRAITAPERASCTTFFGAKAGLTL